MAIVKMYRCDICGNTFDSMEDARKHEHRHKADEAFRKKHKPMFDTWDVVRQRNSRRRLLVVRVFTDMEDEKPQWWYAVVNLTNKGFEMFHTPEGALVKVASGEQLIDLHGKLSAALEPLKMSIAEFMHFCKEHSDE